MRNWKYVKINRYISNSCFGASAELHVWYNAIYGRQNLFIFPFREGKNYNISHHLAEPCYRGADNSLAGPGRKQATATEDFEFHISCL
jgi:hypothetical protein